MSSVIVKLILILFTAIIWIGAETIFMEQPSQTVTYDESDDSVRNVRYDWNFFGYDWYQELSLPVAKTEYLKSLKRDPACHLNLYRKYIENSLDDDLISDLAMRFEEDAKTVGWQNLDAAYLAISFVQNIEYAEDPEDTEYPKYPLELLWDGSGDCEDTSILLISILKEMGYDCCLIRFEHHAGVGICLDNESGIIFQTVDQLPDENFKGAVRNAFFKADGKKYYYIETTNTGWFPGMLPEEYEDMDPVNVKVY